MSSALTSLLQFSFVALTSVFFLVDPITAIPTFLAMTTRDNRADRRRMARRAAWTCLIVLTAFACAGKLIFRLFGITLPAFKIAGGLILLLIGIEMLQARRSQTKETPPETEEGCEKEDVGMIPLGMPMLAGPGAISTVMVLMSAAPTWWYALPVFAAIAITALNPDPHAPDGSAADRHRGAVHFERPGGCWRGESACHLTKTALLKTGRSLTAERVCCTVTFGGMAESNHQGSQGGLCTCYIASNYKRVS